MDIPQDVLNRAAIIHPAGPRILQQLVEHEGLRHKAYVDTRDVWTIGVGHTHFVKEGDTATDEEIWDWLLEDYIVAISDARYVLTPGLFNGLSEPRAGAFIRMAFNLGRTKLSKFKDMIEAAKVDDWRECAMEIVDSVWAGNPMHEDGAVGARAWEIAAQVRLDRWVNILYC